MQTDLTLPARLAAMREEHRPRREIDGAARVLAYCPEGDEWAWIIPDNERIACPICYSGPKDWRGCHPRTAELEIDAAQRKALLVDHNVLEDRNGGIELVRRNPGGPRALYTNIVTAYAAVFPKEAKRG